MNDCGSGWKEVVGVRKPLLEFQREMVGWAMRVVRRGSVLDVLEVGPVGPGDGLKETERGRESPRFVV